MFSGLMTAREAQGKRENMGEFLAKLLELVWKPVGDWIERRRRLRYWNETAILMSRTTSTVDFDPTAREVLLKHVTDDRVIPANDAGLLASLVEDGYIEVRRARRKEIMPEKYLMDISLKP